MRLTIKRLTIENFKGITSPLEVTFNGDTTCIYGANHSGKTTTMDAMMWLLFGKNSQSEATFGIDPLDENGEVIHNLENKVTATFDMDGNEVTLQRVRKEVWKKQRGMDVDTYSHTTCFYVDGSKYSEKEYKAYISTTLIPEQMFRALTNPAYFPSLKPADQRELLISIVGDITDEEIATQYVDFGKLLEDMNGQSLEEYKRHIGYKINEIKAELETLPGRISENQSALEALREEAGDLNAVRAELEQTERELAETDAILADLSKSVDGQFADLSAKRKEIARVCGEMDDIRISIEAANGKANRSHAIMVDAAKSKEDILRVNLKAVTDEIVACQHAFNTSDMRKQDFRKRWNEVEDMTFTWDGSETCPTCGQRLPDADIAAARSKAMADFNRRKQAAQDALDTEAAQLKESERSNKATMDAAMQRREEFEAAIAEAHAEFTILRGETVETTDYKADSRYIALGNTLEQLQQELSEMEHQANNGDNAATASLRQQTEERKAALQKQRDTLRDQLGKEDMMKRHEQRIATLEQQTRDLNQQLTSEEQREDTARAFENEKLKTLQTRVNKLFSVVRFKMFNRLMNGNTEPTCECMMHGTPYQDLSNSEKINAGLDILRAVCTHHDTYAPVWIDNAESNTDIFATDSQQIRLYVSTDKKLIIT